MRYATKKKEPEAPKEDKHLKVLEELKKTVEAALKPVNVSLTSPEYGKTVNQLEGLLVTAIKQNEHITKIHAAQIERTLKGISAVRTPTVKVDSPVVNVPEQRARSFHMDVMRGDGGYITAVEGTIE